MTQHMPWKDRLHTMNPWIAPRMPFEQVYQGWIDAARHEVLADVAAGMPLVEAISYHTTTELYARPSLTARMIEWYDMATEA